MLTLIILVQSGFTPKQFYADCQSVLEEEDIFGADRFFVEALLATSEYNHFFMLMQAEMRKLANNRK